MIKFLLKYKSQVIFICILILSAFLRLYKLPEIAIFTFDEEHQITMARTIVNDFHLIWIGVSASNLGFYMGPFWVYFTAFWLWLSKGDPLITNYIAAILGIITTFTIYLLSEKMFSKKAGLIASFLYASLPLFVFFDQKYLTPTPVPLLSLLLFFSLYKTFFSDKWWIFFAGLYGLVFHTSLSIFPYGLLAIFLFFKQRKNISRKNIFLSIITFIIVISPLLIFDYFHNWSNLTTPLRFREFTANSQSADISSRLNYFSETLGRIWYLKPGLSSADEIPFACGTIFRDKFPEYDFDSIRTKPSYFLSLASILVLIIFLILPGTWKKREVRMLALSVISLAGAFLFFHGGPFEYYLLGLFPLFLIVFSYLICLLPRKVFFTFLFLIITIAVTGINTVLNVDKSYGLKVKKELIKEVISYVKESPFELENNGVCHEYDGWRYLFTVYGRRPERSNTDQSLAWLYPAETTDIKTRYKVIMSEAKILPKVDTAKTVIIERGGFKAYIIDNEDTFFK